MILDQNTNNQAIANESQNEDNTIENREEDLAEDFYFGAVAR